MKRSLISLAAQAVAGRVPQQSVTLFGVADYSQPEPPVLRLQPSDGFWTGTGFAIDEAIRLAFVKSRQIGVTAAVAAADVRRAAQFAEEVHQHVVLNLRPWQEDILRKVREQPTGSLPWPWDHQAGSVAACCPNAAASCASKSLTTLVRACECWSPDTSRAT